MDLNSITVADFKAQFPRDFPYAPPSIVGNNDYVYDADISRAFLEAQVVFNQGLFGSDAQIRMGYLYVTAHYLCLDLRAALAGIQGSGGSFPVSSRSVGSVSESYAIPERYTDDPLLALYTQTNYGMKYLSLVLPNLVGNMVAVFGGTNP